MYSHEKLSRSGPSYEMRLSAAMRSKELDGNPVAIDLVAKGLALVSYGDLDPDQMASVGLAMQKVADLFAIPEREIRRYLQAAIEGDEWDGGKVQVLLNQFSGSKIAESGRLIIGNWRNAV